MQIGCTEMHPIILGVIVIELIMFGAQGAHYLGRPLKRDQIWYIIFLTLLLALNIANGFLPNPLFDIPLYLQYIFRNGVGFITVAYFPFLFFKKLQIINSQARKRKCIQYFLIMPYPIIFFIAYAVFCDLEKAHRYTIFIPGINNLIMMTLIGMTIWNANRKNANRTGSSQEIFALAMLIIWLFMYPAIYLNWGKSIETVFINLGPTAFSTLFLYNCIKTARQEQQHLHELNSYTIQKEVVTLNCKIHMLSERETEIAIHLCQRLKRQQIAEKLFISVRTVDKHVERIFSKTGVSSREKLLEKLNNNL